MELEHVLRKTLQFLYQPQAAYLQAPPKLRPQLNQAVSETILVGDHGYASGAVAEPFATLLDPELVRPVDESGEVPSAGISANWANGQPDWLEAQLRQCQEFVGRRRHELRHSQGLKDERLVLLKGAHRDRYPPPGWV